MHVKTAITACPWVRTSWDQSGLGIGLQGMALLFVSLATAAASACDWPILRQSLGWAVGQGPVPGSCARLWGRLLGNAPPAP